MKGRERMRETVREKNLSRISDIDVLSKNSAASIISPVIVNAFLTETDLLDTTLSMSTKLHYLDWRYHAKCHF